MTTTKRKPHSEEAWAVRITYDGGYVSFAVGVEGAWPWTSSVWKHAVGYAKTLRDLEFPARVVRVRITEIVPKRKAKR